MDGTATACAAPPRLNVGAGGASPEHWTWKTTLPKPATGAVAPPSDAVVGWRFRLSTRTATPPPSPAGATSYGAAAMESRPAAAPTSAPRPRNGGYFRPTAWLMEMIARAVASSGLPSQYLGLSLSQLPSALCRLISLVSRSLRHERLRPFSSGTASSP